MHMHVHVCAHHYISVPLKLRVTNSGTFKSENSKLRFQTNKCVTVHVYMYIHVCIEYYHQENRTT